MGNLAVGLDKCYETLDEVLEVNTTHHIVVGHASGGRAFDSKSTQSLPPVLPLSILSLETHIPPEGWMELLS